MSFAYWRAGSAGAASAMAANRPGSAFIAGGTDLLQLCKSGIAEPKLVIDISCLPLDRIEPRMKGITIGALARLSDVADHSAIGEDYPVIAQALLASASAQIRNVATIGGNLMQKSRCLYFRSRDLPCNKRAPGSGCAAYAGENRAHAIFGASAHCAATHASDLAVALVALDARLRLGGPEGERRLRLEDFYLEPGDTPWRETVLCPGELVLAVEIERPARRSRYLKLRDRASFEFAVLSVAAALDIGDDSHILEARIAAGGVGTKPWRLRESEAALIGAQPSDTAFREAAARAADGARPLGRNAFKLELLRRAVLRTLTELGGGA